MTLGMLAMEAGQRFSVPVNKQLRRDCRGGCRAPADACQCRWRGTQDDAPLRRRRHLLKFERTLSQAYPANGPWPRRRALAVGAVARLCVTIGLARGPEDDGQSVADRARIVPRACSQFDSNAVMMMSATSLERRWRCFSSVH